MAIAMPVWAACPGQSSHQVAFLLTWHLAPALTQLCIGDVLHAHLQQQSAAKFGHMSAGCVSQALGS